MGGWFRRYRNRVDEHWARIHDEDKAARKAARANPEGLAERRWVRKQSKFIAALRNGGHELSYRTEWMDSVHPDACGYVTTMTCQRCGKKYRGVLLARWTNFSTERPCEPR